MDFVKNKAVLPILLLIVAVIAGIFIWNDLKTPKSDLDHTGYGPEIEEVEIEAGDGTSFEVRAESIDEADERREFVESQIPNLDRVVKVSADLSVESRERIVIGINETTQMLKESYNYLDGWLHLGILRKQIGDYEGAAEAWNFASILRPNDAISLLNLADLYAFYIKDRPKAEKYFLGAIKAEPRNGFAYFQTANFYRDVLQNEAKAREILEQGIFADADPTGDLQELLDLLSK